MRPAPCATQPSAKLITSCTTVVRIAIADCVRPMKCLGTIDISEDCATTPPMARQKPKIICIITAPTRNATNGEGKSGLRDLRHLSALQRFGCGFRCRIELARIFLTVARGNVSAPYTVQAIGGNKIRGAINRQDARDSRGVVKEADTCARN